MLLNLNKSKGKFQSTHRDNPHNQGGGDQSETDNLNNDLNDRSDNEDLNEGYQNGEAVTISSFNDLLKVFGIKMEEDCIFKHKGRYYQLDKESPEFMGIKLMENPQFAESIKLESMNSPMSSASMQQQFQQQQFGMLPVLPGLYQIGPYFPAPQNPFQSQNEFYKMYKQQSVYQAQQQQRFLETDQRFFQTLQHPKMNQTGGFKNNTDVHLAYLFASPLMLETSEGNYHDSLPPIGFKEEFEQILMALEPENIGFRYRYMVANDVNLRECLNDNPIGLHFAGHGYKNVDTTFKQDKKAIMAYRGKGDVLIFEKHDGASSFYSEQDLQYLLETTFRHQKLEFVVVASCHSECVGEIFRKCGAKHVICIDQKKLLQDDAAIHFSRTFYCHVFASNLSICEAFESAKSHVKKQIGPTESEKFKLLLGSDHSKNCKKNDIRSRISQGQLEYKGIKPKILKLPTKVTPFISRNRDMFEVIKTLNDCNILQVFGMPGLGKSSLLKNVSNYIGERNLYRDGLIYLNFETIKTFQELLAFIMQNLEDNLDPQYNMYKIDLQFNQSFRKQEKSRLLKQIYKKLQRFKKGLLLVFDNIDDVAKDYQNDVVSLLTNIVQDSHNSIKILFSSSFFFEQLENYKIKKLRGLSLEDSVELFLTKIPLQNDDLEKFFDWTQIMDLHNFTLERLGESNVKIKLCKHRVHTFKCISDYLVQHPLFDMLGGQPLSLSLIAPLSLKFSMKQIYEQLLDLPMINVFKGKIKEDSLILSLEFSLKILNDSQEKAVELFYLIGITKEGLFEDDLDQLFEEDDTQKKLQSLVELSLVQFETMDKAGKQRRFKVSPFIDKYVEQKLNAQSKRDLHMFLATYYTNKLISLKKEFSKNKDQQQLSNGLIKYEQNILYCMKELFNMDYQRAVPTPLRKQNSKSHAGSPRQTKNQIQKLVDKNLLDIGNATLKLRDSSALGGKTLRVIPKSSVKNAVSGMDLIDNTNLDVSNFKDYFEKRKESMNKPQNQGYDSQTDKDGYYNSGVNESSSDYQTDNTKTITPQREFKIRQQSAKRKQSSTLVADEQVKDPRSQQKPIRDTNLDFNIKNIKINKNFKNDSSQIKNLIRLNNDVSDFDSDLTPGLRLGQQVKQEQHVNNEESILDKDKIQYRRQLKELEKLRKQHINKNRFDQLVKSLTMRMGNSQTDNFEKLFKRGKLDFQSPLQDQLAQLNIYEKLCVHYVSILALLDHRSHEVPKIIYSNENSSAVLDKNELIIPLSNKLLQSNLKMVYIYYLLNQEKYDAVNGENLEMYSLFQDINCPLGEAISLYLKAKYLQKMKRKNAYQKAEKYLLKASAKFELCQDSDGLEQCIDLLEKIQKSHPQIDIIRDKIARVKENLTEENQEILNERLFLDKKHRDQNEDKVHNLLLNIIEYSYLKKEQPKKQSPGTNITAIKEQNMAQGFSPNQYAPVISQSHQKRGTVSTPKVFSKKMINLVNQPKNAFQADQDEHSQQ